MIQAADVFSVHFSLFSELMAINLFIAFPSTVSSHISVLEINLP